MKIKILKPYKSIPAPLEFELPPFTVLTGENGSGKTHLFEALCNPKFSNIFIYDKSLSSIQFQAFNTLTPHVKEQCNPIDINKITNQIWAPLDLAQRSIYEKHGQSNFKTEEEGNKLIQRDLRINPHIDLILNISMKSGIGLLKLKEDDIFEYIDMLNLNNKKLFINQISQIFKLYHIRFIDNYLSKYYEENNIKEAPPFLKDEEFQNKYGPPPWEFMNTILNRLNLPYRVNDPLNSTRDSTFIFKLFHKTKSFAISTDALSSGEKTLMSLSLALYSTAMQGSKVEILILDEPDAPLHPSMSKLMLTILKKDISEKLNIPVLISTHSLATIACAPPESLYKITRDNKTPVRCDLEDSIRILSSGIPNLRVSTESRRQVFVEHHNDVEYYESLFNILSRDHEFTTRPQFLPPHGQNGSNCSDVIDITQKLRDMGNKQAYGLIDHDGTNSAEEQLVVLGLGKRYAIENYIFEPHLLGLYLIHKRFAEPNDLGLPECNSYLTVCKLIKESPEKLQDIVNAVENKISWINSTATKVESELVGGLKIQINNEILITQGHKLEEMLKHTWPRLRSIQSNNGGDKELKMNIINTIINDSPDLLSRDIIDTFKEFV